MKLWISLFTLCAINPLNGASSSQPDLPKISSVARTKAVLLKEFPKSEGYGPTTHIHLGCDYEAPFDCDQAGVFIQQLGATKTSYKWKNFFKEDSRDKPQELDGALEQIVSLATPANVLLQRIGDSAYLREGPGFTWAEIGVLPFSPTDHACMSTGWNWLVTLEDGRLVNLYYCPYFRDEERYDTIKNMPATTYELSGTPYKHISNKDMDNDSDIVKSALTLFAKPETDDTPLRCSFAFSYKSAYSYGTNQDLALIFPHRIMLWKLKANKGTIDAKGTVIPVSKISGTNDHTQYSFNAGIFAHKNNTLYVVGNNFVWRYNSETEALERFRYTDIPDLDGQRLITISPNDGRLAVADPRAGVSVFDTKTMSLLFTILQGSICKAIAINSCILATSVPCISGPSQDSVWHIVQNSEEIS